MRNIAYILILFIASFVISSCDPKIESIYMIENFSNQTLDIEIKSKPYAIHEIYFLTDSHNVVNDTLVSTKTFGNTESANVYLFRIYGKSKHFPKFNDVISNVYSIKISGKQLLKDYTKESNWDNFSSRKNLQVYTFRINESDIQ